MRSLLLPLLLVVLAPAPAAEAPNGGQRPVISRVIVPERPFPNAPQIGPTSAEQRLQCIRAELAHLCDNQWAGEYFCSHSSIAMAPQCGAVVSYYYCAGLPVRMSAEIISADGDFVTLRLLGSLYTPDEDEWEEVTFMRWGDHRFAFPATDIDFVAGCLRDGWLSAFGIETVMGGESFVPRLTGCDSTPLCGEAQLPRGEQWRIQGHHLRARILSRSECGLLHRPAEHGIVRFWARLVLDRGAQDGVVPGTTFRFAAFPDAYARVHSVDSSTCEVFLHGVRIDASRPVPDFDVGAELAVIQRLDCPPDAGVEPCFE